jgi:hypothetical protein
MFNTQLFIEDEGVATNSTRNTKKSRMSLEKIATAKRIMTALLLKRSYQLKEALTKWKENSARVNMDEETQYKVEVLK